MPPAFITILIAIYVLLLAVLGLVCYRSKDIPGKSTIVLVVILAGAIIAVVGMATAAALEGKLASEALAAVLGAAVGAFGAKALDKIFDNKQNHSSSESSPKSQSEQ